MSKPDDTLVNVLVALTAIVLVAAMIAAVPLALIWAVNALFGLGIPFGVRTWLAALVLLAIARGRVKVQRPARG